MKHLGCVILITLMIYLMISFIAMDFNPANWGESKRIALLIMFGVFTFIYSIIVTEI